MVTRRLLPQHKGWLPFSYHHNKKGGGMGALCFTVELPLYLDVLLTYCYLICLHDPQQALPAFDKESIIFCR